ncbi:cohesin domain-containing protein [Thermodesulfobacteriota bacterium]
MKKTLHLTKLTILLIFAMCSVVATVHAQDASLTLDDITVPCTGSVVIPVTLQNAVGGEIAGVSSDIGFDTTYLDFVDCTIGPAGAAVGKEAVSSVVSDGVVRIGVFSSGNVDPIGDGIVAYVTFDVVNPPTDGTDLTNTCSASDPAGNSVTITCGLGAGSISIAKTGDINFDGDVTIDEITQSVRMYLGLDPVAPICDPGADGEVQIHDIVKIINCFLETEECDCQATDLVAVPYETLWAGSGHADSESEAFRHWDGDGSISASCAKCHSTPGYVDYLGADGSAVGSVDSAAALGTTVECIACHNDAARYLDSVTFPSGIIHEGVGEQSRCIECHQGRESTVSVDEYLAGKGVADDDNSTTLGFRNVHYFAAGGTMFGTLAKAGYEFTGKMYDGRFEHVPSHNQCGSCHDEHSLEIKVGECGACHAGFVNADDLRDMRMFGSLTDYDGDGDIEEGMYYEVADLKAKLWETIQAYAVEVANKGIVTDGHTYPYFFKDSNDNGICDPEEANYGNQYKNWTPNLLRATYNYQFICKDPGLYAHGGKYGIQLMVDSIEVLNASLGTPIDMTGTNRDDEGHFDGAAEAWRHWDEISDVDNATFVGEVRDSCARCHSGGGAAFFVEHDVDFAQPVANGMLCLNCHENQEDFARIDVGAVTFPSGVSHEMDDADSNLCNICHQGRKSGLDVDAAIADNSTRFQNVHYYPAGGVLLGADATVGAEYPGETYTAKNVFPAHGTEWDDCVECHMGTKGAEENYSHNVVRPTNANCICHFYDVPQTPGAFDFRNIRKTSVDYDNDGDVTEGLYAEIQGLEALLAAAITAYDPSITQLPGYPYWSGDLDAKTQRATYNLQLSQKEPGAYIHNVSYIAELLADSIEDLTGTPLPWR